jgi:hypothetical protein
MRKLNIIIRLLLIVFASIAFLSKSKGCDHLWNLLASRKGVEPTTWSLKEYRKEATDVAKSLGMVYDRTAVGNEAIVAKLCTELTHSMEEEGLKGAANAEAIACIPVIHQFVEDWVNFSVVFNVDLGPDTIVSTDTIWHWEPIVIDSILISPFEDNKPCIETIETVPSMAAMACTVCDRGIEATTHRQEWSAYMELGELLRTTKGLDRATKRRLAECRIEIGRRCRPYHISVHPSAGGQAGLSKARTSDFFQAIGDAFKKIGACKRS